MRHYDLGDGVRVGIGRHNDDESLNSEESNESNESSELDMSSHSTPMGQQLRSLGQGFFMNKGTDIKREQFNLVRKFESYVSFLTQYQFLENSIHPIDQRPPLKRAHSSCWQTDFKSLVN